VNKIIQGLAVISAINCVGAQARADVDDYFQANRFQEFRRKINGVELCIDPRIELFQVLNIVIGNPAINATDTDYKIAIFQYFEKHRTHPIYEIARGKFRLVFKHMDAPYSLLIALNNDLKFRSDLDDNDWAENPDVEELLTSLRQFMVDTDFIRFFNAQAAFYNLVLDNAAYTLGNFDEKSRIVNYMGVKDPDQHKFSIVLNSLGHGNFGPGISTQSGEEHYAIVSASSSNGSIPTFREHEILELVWHEIGHSFTNPLIDEHWDQLDALSGLHEPITQSMSGQAYGTWKSTCYEHLVRAVTCRLCADKFGEEYARVHSQRRQLGRKFIYTEPIIKTLKVYEKSRDTYPDLRSFMPRIVSTLNEVDQEEIDRLLSSTQAIREPDVDDIPSIGAIYGKDNVVVIYSTNEQDTEANERLIAYVKAKHSDYDFVSDTEALKMDLANYNLFVIGTPWGNRFIEKHLSEIPVRLTANGLIAGKKYEGRGYALISGWINPSNPSNVMVIYTAQHPDDLINFNWVPRGGTDYMVLKHLIPIRADDYKRFSQIWTCY
jgi:hypothetical protein